MVIGIVFSGIVAGLVAAIGALSMGLPLWFAIMMYPIIGTLGAIGYISVAMSREKFSDHVVQAEFATELH